MEGDNSFGLTEKDMMVNGNVTKRMDQAYGKESREIAMSENSSRVNLKDTEFTAGLTEIDMRVNLHLVLNMARAWKSLSTEIHTMVNITLVNPLDMELISGLVGICLKETS